MAVTVELKGNSSLKDIDNFKRNMFGELRRISHTNADILLNSLQNSMRSDTGRGNIYIYKGKRHVASKAFRSPAILTGRYIRSWRTDVIGSEEIRLYTIDPKGKFLEEGTKNMDARPAGKNTIDKESEKLISNWQNMVNL